ncbi:MAG: hypothetical protein ACO3SO_03260 [Luteolibacter sp.]
MKIHFTLLPMAFFAITAHAATINVGTTGNISTIIADNARSIHNADGSVVVAGNGVVSVGYFSNYNNSTDFSTLTAAQIESDWNQLGSTGTVNGRDANGSLANGLFTMGATQTLTLPNAFIGQNVQVIIGNNGSLSTSTEMLIFETSTLFAADPSIQGVDMQTGGFTMFHGIDTYNAGSVVIVNIAAFNGAPFEGSSTGAYQMAAIIPEPSVALLGGFGALLLLRRRRNA